jgi:hypothetical protein
VRARAEASDGDRVHGSAMADEQRGKCPRVTRTCLEDKLAIGGFHTFHDRTGLRHRQVGGVLLRLESVDPVALGALSPARLTSVGGPPSTETLDHHRSIHLGGLVHADLDTLVTALYVTIDDLFGPRTGPAALPSSPMPSWSVWPSPGSCSRGQRTPLAAVRRPATRPPGPVSAHRFGLQPAPAPSRRPGRPGPGRAGHPSAQLVGRAAPGRFHPVPCAASRETVKRSALAAHPGYGYCKSHHRYFWGLRLYVLAAPDGLPVAWCLATPKLGEREVVAAMVDHERGRLRPGLVIVADKGFAGRDFEQLVAGYGAILVRPDRADEPRRHGSLSRWRQWIESTFDTLKDQLGLERHRGRALAGVYVRVAQRLLALAAAIWWNWEIGAPALSAPTTGDQASLPAPRPPTRNSGHLPVRP